MNLSTMITLGVLSVIIMCVFKSLIHKYKKGQLFCGGNCQGCGSHAMCQSTQNILQEYKKEKSDIL